MEEILSIVGMIVASAIIIRTLIQANKALKAFDAERDGE